MCPLPLSPRARAFGHYLNSRDVAHDYHETIDGDHGRIATRRSSIVKERIGTGRYPTKPCRNCAARDHFIALLPRNRPERGMGPLAGVLWFFPHGSREYGILRGTQLDESGRKWTVFRFFRHTPPLAIDGGGPHAPHHALPPLCVRVRFSSMGHTSLWDRTMDTGNARPLRRLPYPSSCILPQR